MNVLKHLVLIVGKTLLAFLLILIYWFIAGLYPWLINLNTYTSIFGVLFYVILGFLFFYLKSSKHSGFYGALEVTLGLATFFVPFFFKLGIPGKFPAGLLTESFTSYIAFYSGIYLQVRGFESIYKNWKQNPSKYSSLFNQLFNHVQKLEIPTEEQRDSMVENQARRKKMRGFIPILTLFFLGIFASILIFGTIEDSKDDINNVYYIFSTGAQTIAGLVGLVLAAYTFNHQFMWNARDSNEGTSEIIDETIQKYYNYIKFLSIATGLTLIADLFMLQFNAVQTPLMKPILYIIIGAMNVCVIIAAILIALHIIRPIDIEQWARNLFEERVRENNNLPTLTVNRGEFIDTFITLESLFRNYFNNEHTARHVGLARMARVLFEREIINGRTFEEFLEVNRYRNLVVHGHVPLVEREMYERLQELTEQVRTTLNQ